MPVHLIPIDQEDVLFHVENAFAGDAELLEQYHTSPGPLKHCVENTMQFINENAAYYKKDMEFYALVFGGQVIGYTIVIKNDKVPNELYSFGINMAFRIKEVVTSWLKAVKEILGVPYYIVLWSRNTRAINFFEKNGFAVQRTSKLLNDETKTLIVCEPTKELNLSNL